MYSYSLHRDAHFRQLIITIRASTETTTAYPSALLLLAGLGSWHVFWEVHSNEQFLEDIIYSAPGMPQSKARAPLHPLQLRVML